MAFQSVPNTAELTIVGSKAGQLIVNTFYAQYSSPYDLAALTALASVGDTWWNAYMAPLVSSTYTYLRSHVQGLNAAIDFEAEDSTHTGDTGSAGDEGTPNNVALSVKRSSAYTGRSARGRIYWPDIPTPSLDGTGFVLAAYAEGVVDALMALRDAINDAGRTEVIVSRYSAGVKRTTAVVFETVQYVVVDYALDSQRGRLPGRGV